jgi:hypothetical protein
MKRDTSSEKSKQEEKLKAKQGKQGAARQGKGSSITSIIKSQSPCLLWGKKIRKNTKNRNTKYTTITQPYELTYLNLFLT